MAQPPGSGQASELVPPPGLRELELEECRQGLEMAWREMEALRAEVAEMRDALNASRASVSQLEETASSLQQSLKKRDRLLVRLKQVLVRQRTQNQELESQLTAAETARERAEQDAVPASSRAEARARAQQRDVLIEQLQTDVERQKTEIGALSRDREVADQRIAKLEAELARAKQQNENRERLLREKDDTISDLRAAIAARDRQWEASREERASSAQQVGSEWEAEADAPFAVASVEERSPVPSDSAAPSPSPYRIIARGHRAFREGNLPEARRLFREALAIDSSSTEAQLGLATTYYALGDIPEARELTEAILRKDPEHGRALGLAGILAWQEGDYQLAQRRLEKAVALEPNDAQLHNYAGIVYHSRDKRELAVRALRRSVELDPDNADANFNLAVLLATGRMPAVSEARQYYEAALQLGSARDEKLEQMLYQ